MTPAEFDDVMAEAKRRLLRIAIVARATSSPSTVIMVQWHFARDMLEIIAKHDMTPEQVKTLAQLANEMTL